MKTMIEISWTSSIDFIKKCLFPVRSAEITVKNIASPKNTAMIDLLL